MLLAPISEPYIIDEHGGLVAVYKPRGWHSVEFPSKQGQSGTSMTQWVKTHVRELSSSELAKLIDSMGSSAPRDWGAVSLSPTARARAYDRFYSELGMLYRLDFETSGIMLFALSRSVFERMTRAQEQLALEKRYILMCSESTLGVLGSIPVSRASERAALLENIRAGREWRVESYFRGFGERGARVACIAPEFLQKAHKKTAKNLYETHFVQGALMGSSESNRLFHEVLEKGSPVEHILIEASIRKGFRHQIRAHSAWMGLPIAGDPIYGGSESNRLMLEAHSVALIEGQKVVDEWKLHTGIAELKE